jgi:cobalt-zinc-cadmium efflux system membrane fusion protein
MLTVCTASSSTDEVARELLGVRIGEAKSRLLRAHAALKLARVTLDREESLRQKEVGTAKLFEAARSGLAAAEADFLATHEAIAFADERELLAAARDLKVTKSDTEAAERGLQIFGVTDAELAAVGTEPGRTLSRYSLRSPVAGRVVKRQAVVGELVQERDALYAVADLSTMWLLMDVYVRDLVLVRVGLPVIFTVDGLPGHSFEGHVAWVSDTVDDRTRTIKVRGNLPNERGLLKANMFGLARIIVRDEEELPCVPVDAVQTDGCCQLVFVKKEDALFEPRKVTLGASANGYVEILDGLALGEQVVTVGSFLMKTEILKANLGAGCCEVDPGR